MAFHHFHKYSKQYLAFASVAMIFSLFVFSIPTALTAFTGHSSTIGKKPWLRFHLAPSRDPSNLQSSEPGEEVVLTYAEWMVLQQEIHGFVQAYPLLTPGDYQSAPLVHAIGLAEAERMGIEIPPSLVAQHEQTFLEYTKMRMGSKPSLTRGERDRFLANCGIDHPTFLRRLEEALKVNFYAQNVLGVSVYDPADVERYFVNRAEEVTLEYVAFPFTDAKEEARAALPSDEDLTSYFDKLSDFQLGDEFMNPDRFVVDFALMDTSSFDPDALAEEFRGETTEPTDAEILSQYRGDPERYGSAEKVESAADVPEEAHQKILRDRRLRSALRKLRTDFDAAAAEIALSAKGEPAEGESAEDVEPKKSADEVNEEQRALFEKMAKERGFTFQRSESTREGLAELDPPGDPNLEFFLSSWSDAGQTLAVEASAEKKFAYVVRLFDRQRRARKSFEEVREQVVERWLDERAEELALEKARSFRKSIRSQALAANSAAAAALQAVEAEERAKVESEESLGEATKKADLDALDRKYFDYYLAVVGPTEGPIFDKEADAAGLARVQLGPHRRTIQSTPHFQDRFSGAERYLYQQYSSFSRAPQLLGYAEGCVGDVMVDGEGKAAYVAKVLRRSRPSLLEMTPKDRLNAETDSRRVETKRSSIEYLNPFSPRNLQKLHAPELMVLDRPLGEAAPPTDDYPQ